MTEFKNKVTNNHVCQYKLIEQNTTYERIEMHLKSNALLIVQVEECIETNNTYVLEQGSLLQIDENKIYEAGHEFVFKNIEAPIIFQCLEAVDLTWSIDKLIFDTLNFENDVIMDTLEIIKLKDDYTKEHSTRVGDLAKGLAIAYGCNGRTVSNLAIAALAHDVGKVKIEDHILNKPSRLSDSEYEIIKKHVKYGYDILQNDLPNDILNIIMCHHERLDGSGYPNNLKSDDIPLGAKILAIVDSYDAMYTERPYKKGMPIDKIVDELRRCKGSWYDEDLVELFINKVINYKNC